MRKHMQEEMQKRLQEYESVMSSASAGFNADDKGAANGANGAGSEPHLVNINEDQVSLGSSTSVMHPRAASTPPPNHPTTV